ncbi:hypothetical protein G9A89_008914 [Geosiphon pyriformis]|nr:hypothetical protein G9A89_008914 [Geosiphon pyriformis]
MRISSLIFISLFYFSSLINSKTSAQVDIIDLSAKCLMTGEAFLGSPELSKCFPFSSVQSQFASDGINIDESIANSLKDICDAPKCDDKLIQNAIDKLNVGCQSDIKNNNTIVLGFQQGLQFYSPLRDSLCLKTSGGKFCIAETIKIVKEFVTSDANLANLTLAIEAPITIFDSIPKSLACTTCNKAVGNILLNFAKSNPQALKNISSFIGFTQEDVTNAIEKKCGKEFLNGKVQLDNLTTNGTTSNITSGSQKSVASNNNYYFSTISFFSAASIIVSFALF